MNPVRVLLADDHAVVRAGLRNALAGLPELEVVGEVSNGHELTTLLSSLQPDFLVIDVAMPDFDPVPTIRKIKLDYPELKILVVSAHDDEAYVVGLLGVGVDGYHLKDQPLAELILAVQRILAGERWISRPLLDRLVLRKPREVAADVPTLTRRQRELFRLLSQGYDNRRIAQELELSVKTVENQLTGLYRALNVNSRFEALSYATRHPEVLALIGEEAAAPVAAPGTELTLLVVDDNPRYRQLLSRLIKKVYAPASVYEAEDTREALQLVQHISMQLALIDVVLHDEDGIQCTRRLKAASPATRVLLISAYPDREFRRLGLGAGAIAFLDKKDLDAGTLRQVIDDTLGYR